MSFEGYYQVLCKRGHASVRGLYDFDEADWFCSRPIEGDVCGEKQVWWNLVDETNARENYVELEEITPRVTKTCNLGHVHVWSGAIHMRPGETPLSVLGKAADSGIDDVEDPPKGKSL